MVEIELVNTVPTSKDGQYDQTWKVNGVEHSTTAEWGNVEFDTADQILIPEPEVTVHDVITLALHGNGPTQDGETIQ